MYCMKFLNFCEQRNHKFRPRGFRVPFCCSTQPIFFRLNQIWTLYVSESVEHFIHVIHIWIQIWFMPSTIGSPTLFYIWVVYCLEVTFFKTKASHIKTAEPQILEPLCDIHTSHYVSPMYYQWTWWRNITKSYKLSWYAWPTLESCFWTHPTTQV